MTQNLAILPTWDPLPAAEAEVIVVIVLLVTPTVMAVDETTFNFIEGICREVVEQFL